MALIYHAFDGKLSGQKMKELISLHEDNQNMHFQFGCFLTAERQSSTYTFHFLERGTQRKLLLS